VAGAECPWWAACGVLAVPQAASVTPRAHREQVAANRRTGMITGRKYPDK
jgi:hypothetical protein